MLFILEYWTSLVNLELNPEKNPDLSVGEKESRILIERSLGEIEVARQEVIMSLLQKRKVSDKKEYIRLIVMILSGMENRLSGFMEMAENKALQRLYSQIRQHLKVFFLFLQEIFCSYFNCQQKLPAEFLKEQIEEVAILVKELKDGFFISSIHNRDIRFLLENNFNDFLSTSVKGTSLCELLYHKMLAIELLEIADNAIGKTLERSLFFFNYNDHQLCKIINTDIAEKVKLQKSKMQKIATLLYEQKRINQYPVKVDFTLRRDLPSLKDQVNQWIDEELKCLESETPSHQGNNNEVAYVHVPFRGTEIYLLHKAFIDSGGTSGETYKSLFEKTSAHLINNNQKGFSPESLQKNADKVNYEVKENVKRFLQKMIRNIDSY